MISFAARKKEWLRQYKEDQMRMLDAQGRQGPNGVMHPTMDVKRKRFLMGD